MLNRLVIALAGAAAATAGGCADPCVELSKKICRCEPTEVRQQACIERVEEEADNLSDGERPSEAEENRCAELVDSCTCEKLAAGDFAACGLTRPDA